MTDTKAYNELKKLVDKGELSITHIDAPVRTAGSALFASLSNVHDVSLYQPHLKNAGHYFEHILEKYKEAQSTNKPVKMLIKDLATSLTPDEWDKMMTLTDNVVVILRDPQLQMESIFRIRASTLKGGLSAPDQVSAKEAWDMIDQIEPLYRTDRRGDYYLTHWQSLSEHLVRFDSYIKKHPDKKITIVDGFLLRADPYGMMDEVLNRMEVPHNQRTLDKVVCDWAPEAAQAISAGARATASVEKVTMSTGYIPPLESPPSFDQFPDGLQAHLADLAIPTYIDFLRWPQRVGPKTLDALETLLHKKAGEFTVTPKEQETLEKTFGKAAKDITLEEVNPVEAYALTASLDRTGLNSSQSQAIDRKLSQLRDRFTNHTHTFDAIDHVISGHDKPSDTLTITHIDEGHALAKGRAR